MALQSQEQSVLLAEVSTGVVETKQFVQILYRFCTDLVTRIMLALVLWLVYLFVCRQYICLRYF